MSSRNSYKYAERLRDKMGERHFRLFDRGANHLKSENTETESYSMEIQSEYLDLKGARKVVECHLERDPVTKELTPVFSTSNNPIKKKKKK